jgi:hypothetical protein
MINIQISSEGFNYYKQKSSTHSSSEPGGISPGHTSTKALSGTTNYSKVEYTNTQQDLTVG